MSSKISPLLIQSLKIPYFETLEELSELTRLSTRLLYCLSMRTEKYYKIVAIPKRNGKFREISMPSYTLYIVQKWILVEILNKLIPSNRAMAFRKGKNFGHKQNAIYHADTLYGLAIDLKDFFSSITADKIYTVFSSLGYNNFAATILTNLCTLNGKLPQGSACSPAISNIVCLNIDKRLIGLCEKRGIRYSRYADDMYFSCDDKLLLLKNYPIIRKIVEDEKYVLNERKTHFHTPSNKKQITGIIISSKKTRDAVEFELKTPRKLKQKIRAEILTCLVSGNYERKEHILGEIAYVNFIERENKFPYEKRIKDYIEKQLRKIQYFPELVEAYNKNRFFKDLTLAETKEIVAATEAEFDELEENFRERKEFLEKKGLEDVCQYLNWSEKVLVDNGNIEGKSNV